MMRLSVTNQKLSSVHNVTLMHWQNTACSIWQWGTKWKAFCFYQWLIPSQRKIKLNSYWDRNVQCSSFFLSSLKHLISTAFCRTAVELWSTSSDRLSKIHFTRVHKFMLIVFGLVWAINNCHPHIKCDSVTPGMDQPLTCSGIMSSGEMEATTVESDLQVKLQKLILKKMPDQHLWFSGSFLQKEQHRK